MTALALRASNEVDVWSTQLGARSLSANFVSGRRLQSQTSNDALSDNAQFRHPSQSSVPVHPGSSLSSPHNNGADDMERASERNARNLRVSRNEVADHMRLAVNNAIPNHVEPAKAAAQKIKCSPRTVEALKQRIPDAMVTVGMLGLAYPEFAIAMAEMWGINIDDPKGYAMFIAMQRHAMEKMK